MQPHVIRRHSLRFFGFLAIGIVLRLVMQQAPTPEKVQDLWFALPAFAVFVLFILGICSWGAFFRSKLKGPFFSREEEALFDLSVGSALAYVFSYLVTPIGLFSASSGIFLWIVLGIGFALGSGSLRVCQRFDQWFGFGTTTWLSKFFMALIPLIVFIKLVEGLQFHQHGDSYVTYLVGPRAWGESGNFQGFLRYSQLFLSTSWESLYAWGTALMGFRGGAGLDVSQWFSQWVTGGIGVLGVFFAALALCRRMALVFPLASTWFPVIAITAVQVPVLRWTQNLAKNDFGIAFWAMSAFYFAIYGAALSPGLAFFAGVLTGAAVVGKFTMVIIGALISLQVLFGARKNGIPFILGGLTGSMPVFIRNFTLTNNPVFPWMPKLFPSPYLSEFAEHGASAATQKPFLLSDAGMYASELLYETPLLPVILIVLILSRYRKDALKLLWIPVAAFIVFTVTVRPSTGIRYQNASLILLCLFSAYWSFFILDRLAGKVIAARKAVATAILAFILLGTSNLTFFTLAQIGRSSKFSTFSKQMEHTNQIGGPAKAWIRSHISPSETILSFGDVHIYYLIDYHLTDVAQNVEYGKKIFHSTLDEAEQVFKTAPFDYLYLAGEDYFKDASFAADQAKIEDIMKRANTWNAACKRFDNTKAQVWDLKCLKNNS